MAKLGVHALLWLQCATYVWFKAKARVVSVADLHGDYGRTLQILTAAQLVDPVTMAWIGGNATLVQTGDIVDRGPHAKQIYELFFRLKEEAQQAGGRVITLMGNHELMNIQGDLRYVSNEDVDTFGGVAARDKAWSRDGWLGSKVRQFPAIAAAGGVLFAHAGLLPQFLRDKSGLESVNKQMIAAIEGKGSFHLIGAHGPVWARYFAGDESQEMCGAVTRVLQLSGTERMVVGHTIQQTIKGFRIHSACGGRLLLADTGISRAYGGVASYIEHDGTGGTVAVYPDLGHHDVLPRPSGIPALAQASEAPQSADVIL